MKIVLGSLGLLLLGVVACGSSKEPALYALESRPGTPARGGPHLVELRRPAVAGYLDRENIVTKVHNYRLDVNTGERWAEPLGDMVGRVLSRDLSSRLTDTQVILENGAVSAVPDATIAVIVQSFDELGDGKVRLIAQVVVEQQAAPPHTSQVQTFELSAQEAGSNTESLVAAMSALLGDLAERIAVTVRQLPNAPPPPPAPAPAPAAIVVPR